MASTVVLRVALVFLLLFQVAASFGQTAAERWKGKLGTYDTQGKLTNDQQAAFKFSIRTFGVYLPNDGDFTLGFSVVPWYNPRNKLDFSIDLAPHLFGVGLNWTLIDSIGLGIGAACLYNTSDDKFVPAIKLQIKRW